MYFKLALQNVKKSYKDYLIYFLTLSFSVCLFYTFNSFQDQQAMMELSESQMQLVTSLAMLMSILSVFVAGVLAFLILYANNFLIKRRKKEFGLYTLLGMPKGKISRVLVYETFFIGLLSLISGILLGLLASQLLTVLTANLFEVILNYSFVFSVDATILTIVSFTIIFIIVMLFNSVVINRYKLIDLLNADRKSEILKVKNVIVSVIIFITSILLLGSIYYYSWIAGGEAFLMIIPIGIIGILGTVLFFMSLSGFLLRFMQTSKSVYFKNLNMFMLRQINANINSNFLSMSIVCIMLLFSIGALSTGINLSSTFNQTIKATTPYDYSYIHYSQTDELERMINSLPLDKAKYIETESYIHLYKSDVTYELLLPYMKSDTSKQMITNATTNTNNGQYIEMISLTEYNTLLKQYGLEPISLTDNQGYLMTSSDLMDPIIQDILMDNPTFHVFDTDIQIMNTDYETINACTTDMVNTFTITMVVPDHVIKENTTMYANYYNVDLKEDIEPADFRSYITGEMNTYNSMLSQEESKGFRTNFSVDATLVKEANKGMAVIFTYIGIYLGIVFLIASTVILALQQLSQANDNKNRFAVLDKIGTDKAMMNRSILLQLSIYLFMPLLLAICHSIIGIHVVNDLTVVLGNVDLFSSSLYTGGIIILIYGSYFYLTYTTYKNIVK